MKSLSILFLSSAIVAVVRSNPCQNNEDVFFPDAEGHKQNCVDSFSRENLFFPDCHWFYECVEGSVVGHMKCPDGLLWNQDLLICDWNSDCNVDGRSKHFWIWYLDCLVLHNDHVDNKWLSKKIKIHLVRKHPACVVVKVFHHWPRQEPEGTLVVVESFCQSGNSIWDSKDCQRSKQKYAFSESLVAEFEGFLIFSTSWRTWS